MPVTSATLMLGSPVVNSLTLMPRMPRLSAALMPKSDWTVSGLVSAKPNRNSFTAVAPRTRVQLTAPPWVLSRVFWIPATKGPRSNRDAAKSGVGRQRAA